MIAEDYCSYEVAKLLKEKGFNEPCFMSYWLRTKDKPELAHLEQTSNNYSDCVSCPTQQMAMKWLREVYNIIIEPESVWNGKKWEYQLFIVTPQNADSPYYEHNPYKSYEECVEAAIKYCLEKLL